jgi:uncharacterized membrane protein
MSDRTIRRSNVLGTWLLLLGLLLLLSASLLVTPKAAERSSLGETDNIVGVLPQQETPYVEAIGETPPVVAGEVITREGAAPPAPRPAVEAARVRLPVTGLGFGRAVAIVGLVLIVSGVLLLIRGSKRSVGSERSV